jgi:hypothetical protein
VSLSDLLVSAVRALKKHDCTFAVGGAFAANIYRSEVRATEDIDFGIIAPGRDLEIVEAVWSELGIQGRVVTRREASLAPTFEPGAKWMMVADKRESRRVDFMLWALDWVTRAVERAQANVHPIPQGETAPFMTLEDVLVAKAFAVHHISAKQDPYKHMSDIQDILVHNDKQVDLQYLAARLHECKVSLPKVMKPSLPLAFQSLTKGKNY